MSSLFLVVTGASKGIGQAVATAFVRNASTELSMIRIVLVARSKDGLLETEELITKERQAHQTIHVGIRIIDLSQLDELDGEIDSLLEEEASSFCNCDRVVLINNAGSLGHLGSSMELKSFRDFRQTVDLNVTSSLWLAVRFVQEFLKYKKTGDGSSTATSQRCDVINISSICAVEPFPTMSIYSAGKAARDMFHEALAQEDCSRYNVKFLNYAPGACDTDMTTELSECHDLDDKLQTFFRTSRDEDKFVKPEDTATKLVKLVLEKDFESGKHIDYWDVADD